MYPIIDPNNPKIQVDAPTLGLSLIRLENKFPPMPVIK